jgi:hypothetical protein
MNEKRGVGGRGGGGKKKLECDFLNFFHKKICRRRWVREGVAGIGLGVIA